MRVNIYAEEMTQRVELVEKTIDGQRFTGVRFYLELPVSYQWNLQTRGVETVSPGERGQVEQLQGPFIHRPGDDDSAAVTFWGKQDLRRALTKALELLDRAGHGVPEQQAKATTEDKHYFLHTLIQQAACPGQFREVLRRIVKQLP